MRKEKEVHITAEGRDLGKIFIIKEMSAWDSERWAFRAFLALTKSGVEIPENVAGAGIAGIAILGLKALAGLDFAEAKPLFDEMFLCVQYRPDPKNPAYTRAPKDDDIEEVVTLLYLRLEIFTLHTGFSLGGVPSKPTPEKARPASPTIRTSRRR